MDKIIEFHLESDIDRSSISFNVDDEKKIMIPIQNKNSNKLTTSFVTSEREFEVLSELVPEDTRIRIHDGESFEKLQCDNQIEPYSDHVQPFSKAMKNKHISILVLDPFVFERNTMSLIEYQIRVIRILLAQKNIACTFHKAYGVNSANYQSYKNEAFVVFEGLRFPLSVFDLNSFDVVLNFENISENFDPKTPFFDAVNELITDFKQEK